MLCLLFSPSFFFYLSFLFFVVSCFSPSPFFRFIFFNHTFFSIFFSLFFPFFLFLLPPFFLISLFMSSFVFQSLFSLHSPSVSSLSLSFHLLTFLDCITFSLSSSPFPWSPFPSPPLVGVLEIPFCISICHFFLFLSFCIHVFWNKFCRLKKSLLYLFIFSFFPDVPSSCFSLFLLLFISPCFWKIFDFHLFINFFLLRLFIFVSFFFFVSLFFRLCDCFQ